jgi:hypothetical protein
MYILSELLGSFVIESASSTPPSARNPYSFLFFLCVVVDCSGDWIALEVGNKVEGGNRFREEGGKSKDKSQYDW